MNISGTLEQHLRIDLTQPISDSVNNLARIRAFSNGTTMLMQGQETDGIYLLIQGIVRGYYLDPNGNDVTKCFSMEGDFICTECFRTGKPATFSVECMEDCQCIELPHALVRSAMHEDKSLAAKVSRLFEQEINKLEHRNKTILLLNAAQRYNSFCKEYPQLQGRISLRHISSYLAVRPETLSRVRKKLNPST